MTPKLYQIIQGGDLNVEQFDLVKAFFPEQENQWVYERAFYFSTWGLFMQVWRNTP